jgi:lysophospholipase L1-like esterase
MIRHSLSAILFPLLLAGLPGLAQEAGARPATGPDPTRFAATIDGFLQRDKLNPPPQRAILFIGSSIFRQWQDVEGQMAPLPVFNRAFGGSTTADLLYYMDQVVIPYAPRMIVYYCGSNDINAGIEPEVVFGHFREFAERVWEKLPQTHLFYVSINRAPQKRARWDKVDAANALVRAYCMRSSKLQYIDVNPVLFDARGEPRMELYLPDGLHFQAPAYVEFAAIVKPVLARAWYRK